MDLVRTQEQLDALKSTGFKTYGRDPYLGMILYKDIRGANYSESPDGKIDDNDLTLLSENNTPRINYGFGLNANWKGFSVSALLQGVLAYDRVISNLEGGEFVSMAVLFDRIILSGQAMFGQQIIHRQIIRE